MASIGFLIGGALVNALAFTGSTLVLKAWENHGKTIEKAWGKFHGFP